MTLLEKARKWKDFDEDFISVDDLKESIKELKEELNNKNWKEITNEHVIDLFDTIDKHLGFNK